jgi:four helix bundle protein
MKKSRATTFGRVKEEPSEDYGVEGRTSNVQRPTSNVQRGEGGAGDSGQRRFDLEERLLEYAVRIIRLVDALPASRAGRHAADQLLRCGTSPLANHGELQGAESRNDFIHKLGLCLKEIREARRWLRLVHRVPLLKPSKVDPLIAETESLIKIFAASIRTAKRGKE